MTNMSAYIAGIGVVSALGSDLRQTLESLTTGRCGLKPLDLFPVPMTPPLPAGMATPADSSDALPRTHQLARLAADQALAGLKEPPDAIVLGTTTGGILTTETLFARQNGQAAAYRHHGLGSVTEDLARHCGCTGPLITVSTACSSGAVAIKLALEMLRRGRVRRILTGGVDALSRLTYFGFHSLQLVDSDGARPLDRTRRGMSVAEGAGMLLLTTAPDDSSGCHVLGAGMSCDAYHATTPHPQGQEALAAMRAALADAGLAADAVDYINLHGTGTPDNDLAEARAVHALFPSGPPPLSSTKGATGHTLAAAGAIEAIIACAAIENQMAPGNTGYRQFDPELDLTPVVETKQMPVTVAMSNAFGFGGNNAALVIGRPGGPEKTTPEAVEPPPLTITGWSCLTGAGRTDATRQAFLSGSACSGLLESDILRQDLPPRTIRRLKRLSTMALALATDACLGRDAERSPRMITMGTAWGALSETHDFLQRLNETQMQFPSPTDFVGSVHNAPAAQIAMMLGAKGANATVSGGDYSFEQALLSAELLTGQNAGPVLLIGADEYHSRFSPLFDPSVAAGRRPADGGGALILERGSASGGPLIALVHYQAADNEDSVAALVDGLGGPGAIRDSFGAVMANVPAGRRRTAQGQLENFIAASGFNGPLIDFRPMLGEFATASATAAVMAVELLDLGAIPAPLAGGQEANLDGKGVLILGLGSYLTAITLTSGIRIPPQ